MKPALLFATCTHPDGGRDTITVSNLLLMTWIWEYLEDVVAEMEKVNWPSRDELISSTLITIVATLMISGFIFLADQVIQRTLRILYQV